MDRDSTFSRDDHRNFNRHGQAFDVGETFSGVDFETGLEAVERLRPLVPPGATMTRLALRWILMFEAVTCVIPGAKNRLQAVENAAAPDLEELTRAKMEEIRNIYDEMIRGQVHHRW
jgi:aryl-alcohol dehydrogenase-like predicted oxidoreductase